MERRIVHMDLDSFFVSCERLEDGSLIGVPVIIGGSERGVVASCSYEARQFGVRSAMPVKAAIKLCPEARIVRGNMELYSKYSQMVSEIIRENAPLMQKASIDEHYLDITGLDKFFGAYKWTCELAEKITKSTGLPISFALSANKTVAKIGTGEAKPFGRLEIPEQQIKSFLAPLSIKKIPMLGKSTFDLLSNKDIHTIKELAETPIEILENLIGKNGTSLWKKANGIDNSPVEPDHERKSISTEQTFSKDIEDPKSLHGLLAKMVEKLAFKLRKEQWLTSTITMKIRYSDFKTENKQSSISYTSADHILLSASKDLFAKLCKRGRKIRLIGIRFSGLVRGSMQVNLFEETEQISALYEAMDKLKTKFGHDALGRASGYEKNGRSS